ncbi:hypothetical protein ABQZ69_02185 [Xanthomonas sp. WHRI 8391]|uniref:Uncharacterized protein n=1 Tax=Xanthomonas hortorum TaxID=56454 RepID=A0AA47IDK6_9XANT|nr:hypothetical protein [Xanthomonas hortorum]UTS72826.1 hypothetical protein NMB96_20715 [Xanthomonas hortorum]WAH65959.1 hypothetical protein OEG85_08485 [Xanthomonas hortorum]
MIRQVGDYVLTAHAATVDAMFFPEILVSRIGGLTLHQYWLPTSGFATYARAVAHAQDQLMGCGVSSDGSLLMCHTGSKDTPVTELREHSRRTFQLK